MIASATTDVRLLRRLNLMACFAAAVVIGWLAAGPAWSGGLFACWSALPLLVGVPVALTASQKPQQLAIASATALSFAVGLVEVRELSHSANAFTPLVAWALPGAHLAGSLALLAILVSAASWLKLRSTAD